MPRNNTIQKSVPTVQICGFDLLTGSSVDNIELLQNLVESGDGGWVVTLNTEMISRASSNQEYGEFLRSADYVVADGMPIVWASQSPKKSQVIKGRTTGVDIVEHELKYGKTKFAIIGGVSPEETLNGYDNALDRCVYLNAEKFSGSKEDIDLLGRELKSASPQFVFIALGVPKQDVYANKLRKYLPHSVLIGIGGSFEILSDHSRRAPNWMQEIGLEWLFRLSREPGRLWKRYLMQYPRGIGCLFRDAFKLG